MTQTVIDCYNERKLNTLKGDFMTKLVSSKKTAVFMVLFCLIFLGMAAPAYGQASNPNFPPWLFDQPPANEHWGIGTANFDESENPAALSVLRARMYIVSILYSRFSLAGDEDENFLFNEVFFQQFLTIVSLRMANDMRVLRQWEAPDGNVWSLVAMRIPDVSRYPTSFFDNLYQEYHRLFFGRPPN